MFLFSFVYFISSPVKCSVGKKKHAKIIIAFISCAKDSFEKSVSWCVHTGTGLFVSLHFSLSVSEIEKETSQFIKKRKETVTFLQTFIYFPFFFFAFLNMVLNTYVYRPH